MDLFKLFIVLIIIILTILIVFRIFQKRRTILYGEEGFTSGSTLISNPLSVQNITSARANLSLFEYCIKASYNSAFNGNNITLLALDNVISRGCRFLDFEIYSVDESPCVAYSTDPTFSTLTSGNSLLLKDVFNEIIGNCFTSNAPNPRDPLFIHLRVNTNCGIGNSAPCDIYQQVGAVIQTTLFTKLHVDASGNAIPVKGATPLSELAGKIVIVMDASVNRDYKNYAVCDISNNKTCYNLRNYINIESGGSEWKKYKFSDFINKAQNQLVVDSTDSMVAEPTTGTLALQMVLPDVGANVQNASFPLTNIAAFGCQTIAMKFYKNDVGLKAYEALFNEYNTAFVPLGFAVQYLGKENT
jgi:hypothetical protein